MVFFYWSWTVEITYCPCMKKRSSDILHNIFFCFTEEIKCSVLESSSIKMHVREGKREIKHLYLINGLKVNFKVV